MNGHLHARRHAAAPVRVRVAAHQEELKEEHGSGPDGSRSAEPRDDVARDERLDLEQKEGPEKDGQCKRALELLDHLAPPSGTSRCLQSNDSLPWCTTPKKGRARLGRDWHHPIISPSGIPSAVMVLRILHPILASTLYDVSPLARIAGPTAVLYL